MATESKITDDVLAKLSERVKTKKAIPRAGEAQLPLWKEHLRGLPNAMARSALFTCANPNADRREYKREKIHSVAGYEIYYNGIELRQDDEDVFLQVVHFARMHPLGDVVEISGKALLNALGWNGSSKSYNRLRDIIERLKEGTIKISHESGNIGYAGSLIRKFAWQTQEKSGARTKWKIFLEKEIIALFVDDAYTLLDWEDRAGLGPLAKWLHSFYYTHKQPFPYKTKTLHSLSGSKSKTMNSFRRDLRAAHDELESIGFLKSWHHDAATDTFVVTRALKVIPTQA
mgnify:CR=1 FL=1